MRRKHVARTTLDLDPELLSKTQKATGAKTKKAAIEEAMREFLNMRRREALIAMLGNTDIDLTPEQLKEWRRQSIRFNEAD
jgi:Arc/MetJ family transcription regulator